MAKATTTSAAAPAQEQEQGAPALQPSAETIAAAKHDAILLAEDTRQIIRGSPGPALLARCLVSVASTWLNLGLVAGEAEETPAPDTSIPIEYVLAEYANLLAPELLAALSIPEQPDQALIRSVVHETLDQIQKRGQAAKAQRAGAS